MEIYRIKKIRKTQRKFVCNCSSCICPSGPSDRWENLVSLKFCRTTEQATHLIGWDILTTTKINFIGSLAQDQFRYSCYTFALFEYFRQLTFQRSWFCYNSRDVWRIRVTLCSDGYRSIKEEGDEGRISSIVSLFSLKWLTKYPFAIFLFIKFYLVATLFLELIST